MTENENAAVERRKQLIVTLNDQAASNSRRREIDERGDLPPKKEVSKVAAKAKIKKESFGQKFKKAFFGEDVENVGEYMLFDVGIPALKATISDMFSNGLEVLLFGESRGRRRRDKDNTSYARIYRSGSSDRDRDDRSRRDSNNLSYRDIYFDTKKEANDFISEVLDYVTDYGRISIAVYISMAVDSSDMRIRTTWDDDHKGWYKEDLAGLQPIRTRDGWEIDIPRPVKI